MFLFIRLGALFLVVVVVIIVFTQIILPSIKGTQSWPYFRNRKAKELENVKSEIKDVDDDMNIQSHEKVLLGKQAEYKNNQQELEQEREKLDNNDSE
jgi:hypothetical protein